MKLSPCVNTDIRMPKAMFDALGLHEAFCAFSKIDSVTEESVKQYLADKHGSEFAAKFQPQYLLNSRAP